MSYKKDLRNFGTQVSCFGAVHDVKLMHDRGTGRPRGLGFVRMDDEAGGETLSWPLCMVAIWEGASSRSISPGSGKLAG